MSRNPSLNASGTFNCFSRKKSTAKWIWLSKSLKNDFGIIAANMAIGLFITILSFSIAIFSQILIDELLPKGNPEFLIIGFISLFICLSLRTGLAFIRRKLLFSQHKRISHKITSAFLGLVLHLPKSFFDAHSTARLYSRLNEHKGVQKTISYLTDQLFMDLLLILSTAILLSWYSTAIAAAFFIGIAIFFFVILNFISPSKTRHQDFINADNSDQEQYFELFQHIETIKNNNAETYFMARNEEIQHQLHHKEESLLQSKNCRALIADLLTAIFTMVITGLSYLLVSRHELKTGELTAIIILCISLFPAIYRSSQIKSKLGEFNLIVDRIYHFSTTKKEYHQQEKEELQWIKFQSLHVKNLNFSFPGCTPILRDISFQIAAGESIALLGESGSGKSTVFSILQKLYTPQSGSIALNEQSLKHISTPSLRNIMAIVPQEVKIFNGTLMDNIALDSPHKSPSSIIEFCLNTGLHRFFQSLPQGYLTQIGEGKPKLSSGQKQLVGIARALYRRPQLLLLDEVTAFMDSSMEKFTHELLARFKRNTAIILITHKTETIRLADRIYVIREGQLEDPHKFITFSS